MRLKNSNTNCRPYLVAFRRLWFAWVYRCEGCHCHQWKESCRCWILSPCWLFLERLRELFWRPPGNCNLRRFRKLRPTFRCGCRPDQWPTNDLQLLCRVQSECISEYNLKSNQWFLVSSFRILVDLRSWSSDSWRIAMRFYSWSNHVWRFCHPCPFHWRFFLLPGIFPKLRLHPALILVENY